MSRPGLLATGSFPPLSLTWVEDPSGGRGRGGPRRGHRQLHDPGLRGGGQPDSRVDEGRGRWHPGSRVGRCGGEGPPPRLEERPDASSAPRSTGDSVLPLPTLAHWPVGECSLLEHLLLRTPTLERGSTVGPHPCSTGLSSSSLGPEGSFSWY